MREMRKVSLFIVLTLVGLLGLSACGDSNPPAATAVPTAATTAPTAVTEPTTEPTAAEVATTAPTTEPTAAEVATTEPTTAVSEPTATTGGGGGNGNVSADVADALRKYYQAFTAVQSYHIVQETQAAGQTIKAEGDHQAPDRTRLTLDTGAGGQIETISIGPDSYTKIPTLGDSYTHTSTAANATSAAMDIVPFVTEGSIVGDETVDGVAVQHFKITYDVDKMLAAIANQTGTPVAPGATMGTAMMELWVDKSTNLPVKQIVTTSGAAPSTSTITYSKYNETVSPPIEKPTNVTEMPGVPSIEIPTIPAP